MYVHTYLHYVRKYVQVSYGTRQVGMRRNYFFASNIYEYFKVMANTEFVLKYESEY